MVGHKNRRLKRVAATKQQSINLDDLVDVPDIAEDLRAVQEKLGAEFEVPVYSTICCQLKRCQRAASNDWSPSNCWRM